MGIEIIFRGGEELKRSLEAHDEALTQPLGPLFAAISDNWREGVLERFETGGTEQGPWEELGPYTRAARELEGYGPEGPILKRTGDLVNSLTTQTFEDGFRLFADDPGARLLHYGGRTSLRSRVPGAKVPARPFLYLSRVMVDDAVVQIREYFAPQEGEAGA